MLLDDGVGALPKVLDVYMDEAAWSTKPTQGMASMGVGPTWGHSCQICFWVVVVLLQQCIDQIKIDQLKIASNDWVIIKEKFECMCKRVGHLPMSLKVQCIGS